MTARELPEIVCLCGSTRFKDAINAENARLTLAGKIVLSMGVFGHVDMPGYDWSTGGTELKQMLDSLHKRKIDLSDRVLVVNVGGYIGESTRSEIEYAEQHGVPVDYLEPVGRAAENSGQHSVSPAPSGDAGSRERLDRPAAYISERDA